MEVYYETGVEETEILGSGSIYWNVKRTTNEQEAFKLFKEGRNYLHKITWTDDNKRLIEWWDYFDNEWRRSY